MRKYNQFCGVARALDVVGERWTLLLIRELLLGPRRYSELLASLPGLTTNLLAARLKHLLSAEIIEKTAAGAYRLTPLGAELEPVVFALGRFGERYLETPRPEDALSPRWAMISWVRRHQPVALRRVIAVGFGPRRFSVRIGGERLEVVEGEGWQADATLSGPPPSWLALMRQGVPLHDLLVAGAMSMTGEAAAAEALVASVGLRVQG